MSRARDILLSGAVLLVSRLRRKPSLDGRERVVPAAPSSPGWELVALFLLLLTAACAVGFIVVYVLDRLSHQTQWLGLSLGLAFVFLAAALIVTAKHLIVTEELEDDYPVIEHPEEQETIAQVVEESGSRLTRRRLFKLGLGAAGGAIGLAALTPVASLGPGIDMDAFVRTPWRRGRRLVDEKGRPWRASDIEQDTFYTAFAEHADKEELSASLVLVRLPEQELRLPAQLAHYPAKGIVAYSKICTHAGCAINLYRTPLFEPVEPKPALVCPCHYSTFDVATGGDVVSGPAGRSLPMLPIYIGDNDELRAGGNFNEPVGPSWWGVRMRKPENGSGA
ncbi:MAG TPA: Rieske (2Fe-2S) protein [Gaiellaceae bacterium]|nr:Rieske (2Fe-2S) protein [Gaiellaceae bacterium]